MSIPSRAARAAAAAFAGLVLAGGVAAQAVEVQPGWPTDAWLRQGEPLRLEVSPFPEPTEGRLAVLVGVTDVTGLMARDGNALVYESAAPPLRAGERELTVYLVKGDGDWEEIGRFPLKVRTRAGFDKVEVTPAVDLNLKGQVAEGHDPADNAPSRATFQDGTLQAGLRTVLARDDFALSASVDVVGVTNREEALRFGEEGEDAPPVDLSGYLVEVEKGRGKLGVGHVSFGSNRLLASSFGGRGATLVLQLSSALSLEAAATSGSSMVGWNNVTGLSNSRHRMLSATVGAELVPSRPGTFRLELSYLDGSLQPDPSFNQGAVTSAETSDGGAIRLLAADFNRRFTLEAGYARTTFNPASDPELEEGLDVVPLASTTRDARYGEASVALVRGAKLGATAEADLTLGLHHQRVEPLYRSVAASLGADVEQNGADLTASLGVASVQGSVQQTDDNLAEIPTILTTRTRRAAVNFGAPLGDLLHAGAWLPTLALGWDRTHQLGVSVPEGGAFLPEDIPDQVSLSLTAGLDWSGERLRGGYHWSRSEQDNRQPGREDADFVTRTDSVTFGAAVSARLDLGLDASLEEADSFEAGRVDRTRRLGLNGSWRPTDAMTFTASVAKTRSWDSLDQGSQDGFDSDAQWSLSFPIGWTGLRNGRCSVFARYSNRRLQSVDLLLDLDQDERQWSVSTGLNLSLF